MEKSLLAPCTYDCGNCVVYKKNKCLGCIEATNKAQSEGRVFCEVSCCAREKKMTTCSDCSSYPCKKYDKSIFTKSHIKWVKDKLKEA